MKSARFHWIKLALLAAAAFGCESGETTSDPCITEEQANNDAIRKGLEAFCKDCHGTGDKGFFASLQAFEDLLVYNEALVIPGEPDKSKLVQLLEGKASGAYSQMPISGDSYAKLVDAGKAPLTMDEVRSWVRDLKPRPKNTKPDPGAITVHRMTAAQIVSTLYAQLGLTGDDFYTPGKNYGVTLAVQKQEDNLAIMSPDWLPGPWGNDSGPLRRYFSLGGNSAVANRDSDLTASPGFVQVLVPLSQRWCKMAIEKQSSQALLFTKTTPDTRSDEDAAGIKANIAYQYQHFLSDRPGDGDVDAIYNDVFIPLEAESDPRTAWSGVCSYFIRHPRWVFY
jgi:hypothetical protein